MIRNWISTHTDNKGLNQALNRMRAAEATKGSKAAEGPKKADVLRLMGRLAGGSIQRSKKGR